MLKPNAKCKKTAICDFSFRQDLAYVKLSPKPQQDVLSNLHGLLEDQLPKPNLLIKVECSVATMQSRIKQRGRPAEQTIPISFLRQLTDEINELYTKIETSKEFVCLTVNTEHTDYRTDEQAAELLSLMVSQELTRSEALP